MIFGIDQFGWPSAFAATPLLIVIAAAAWFRARRRGAVSFSAQRFTAASPVTLRQRLIALPTLLRLFSIAMLIIAIARPQEVAGEARTRTEGVAIQLVIDRSGSMNEEMRRGAETTRRIDVVKEVAEAFVVGDGRGLPGRSGDLVGMIAFALYADTLCPLTQEHDTLVEQLRGLRTAIRQEDGTNMGDALALAAARLRNAETEIARARDAGDDDGTFRIASKAIVLLTDGQNNRGIEDPIAAAETAAEWGIRVYAIGIGSDRFVDFGGIRQRVGSGVDEATLSRIAEITGGRFWLAGDADALREVYAEINELEKTEIETSLASNTKERFTPFAVLALGALALETLLRTLVLRRLP